MYLIMILMLLFLLYICYVAFDRDILFPPVIAVAMFLFSSVVGLLRYEDWNIAEYSGFTVLLIMTGLLTFIFSSYMVYIMFPARSARSFVPVKRERIEMSSFFLLFAVFVVIAQVYLYYDFILKNVGNVYSFSLMINSFRRMGQSEWARLPVPLSLQILAFFSYVLRWFAAFALMHNLIFDRWKKQEFLLVLIIALNIVYNLLDGSRGVILHLTAEIICYCYVFWNMKNGWNHNINKKIIKLGLKIFACFLPLFLVLAIVTGRYGDIDNLDLSRFDALNYITIYVCGGVRNFDLYVEQPITDDTIIGKETFYGLNRFLYSRFGVGEFYDPNLEFRAINGKNIGNIYTVFRRYHADFGILGVILLISMLGAFYTYLYSRVKCDAKRGKVTFFILVFASLVSSIFYFPIDDIFYHFYGRPATVLRYIFLYFVYRFARNNNEIQIRFRRRRST